MAPPTALDDDELRNGQFRLTPERRRIMMPILPVLAGDAGVPVDLQSTDGRPDG